MLKIVSLLVVSHIGFAASTFTGIRPNERQALEILVSSQGDLQLAMGLAILPPSKVALSGDINASNVTSVFNKTGLFLDGCGYTVDCGSVTQCFSVTGDSNVELSDVTIASGNSNMNGGGIYIHSSFLRVVESKFVNNLASEKGGALYASNSVVMLINCSLTNNIAYSGGGGVFVTSTYLNVVICIFYLNRAVYGGGLYAVDSNIDLAGSLFSNNSALLFGGGLFLEGYCYTQIIACSFLGNHAGDSGGGMIAAFSSVAEIYGTIFESNFGKCGGGLKLHESFSQLSNCLVVGNRASTTGGAVDASGGTLALVNSNVSGNLAHQGGGGVCTFYCPIFMSKCNLERNVVNESGSSGGGIYTEGSDSHFIDCSVIANNAIDIGGGLSLIYSNSSVLLRCRIHSNGAREGAGIYIRASNVTISSSSLKWNNASGASGGGVSASESLLQISESMISNNSASSTSTYGGGGGLYLQYSATRLSTCEISSNMVKFNEKGRDYVQGGGAVFMYSSVILENSKVSYNKASRSGGGIYSFISNCSLHNCEIIENTAMIPPSPFVPDDWGGSYGGGIFFFGNTDRTSIFTSNNCTLMKNKANMGGGLLIGDHALGFITLSKFEENIAACESRTQVKNGGGLHIWTSIVIITNCSISQNTAFAASGGGISILSAEIRLYGCTIMHNNASFGSGIYDAGFGNYMVAIGLIYLENGPNNRVDVNQVDGFFSSLICSSDCMSGKFAKCKLLNGTKSCYANCPECKLCPNGKVNHNAHASHFLDCENCTFGRYSYSGLECTSCQPGKYASDDASDHGGGINKQVWTQATMCQKCPRGYYGQSESMVVCQKCDPGKSSDDGAVSCDRAERNYYAKIVENVTTSLGCPDDSICYGGFLLPIPQTNFWVDRRAIKFAGKVYHCPRKTCAGGREMSLTGELLKVTNENQNSSCWHRSVYLTNNKTNNKTDTCDSDALMCLPGASGPLCGSCRENYSYSPSAKICEACEELLLQALYVIVVCSLIGISAVMTTWLRKKNKNILGLSWARVFIKLDPGALRVLWSTAQIIQSASWALDITFPQPFGDLLAAMSFLSIDVLSLGCMSRSGRVSPYLVVYLLSALLPFMIVANNTLAWVRHKCFNHELTSTHRERTFVSLFLSFLILPSVSRSQYQALDCRTIAGKRYMNVDTSVNCDSLSYDTFQVIDILLIIGYLSVPISWFIILYSKRKKLNPNVVDTGLKNFLIMNDPDIVPMQFLFGVYKPELYYFEVVEMLRRILFVGILPLLSRSSTKRAGWGVLIALISAIAYREVQPFKLESTNLLAYVAQLSVVFVFGAALAISTDLGRGLDDLALGLTLVAVNISALLLAIAFAVHRHIVKQHERKRLLQRRAVKIEWACNFDENKFTTTFKSIEDNFISQSHCLIFYYCSNAEAEGMIKSGVLVRSNLNQSGIIFTFNAPHSLDEEDKRVFDGSLEVVFACSLPRRFIQPLSGSSAKSGLRFLPAHILQALRGSYFEDIPNPSPWYNGSTLLPPSRIVRAYLLKEPKESKPLDGDLKEYCPIDDEAHFVVNASSAKPFAVDAVPSTPLYCLDFIAKMASIRSVCNEHGLSPVYHYTHPSSGPLILDSGFRMSTQGQGDGGVYFSTLGPTSYDLGSDSYEANIITDCFGKSRLEEYRGKHKLDLLIVYGVDPWTLTPAPGGRDNAVMVSKDAFETLSLPQPDGNFFLRPDRIFGMFLLDPENPPHSFEEAQNEFQEERLRDKSVKDAIHAIQRKMKLHEKNDKSWHERVIQERTAPGAAIRSPTKSLDGNGMPFRTPQTNRATVMPGSMKNVFRQLGSLTNKFRSSDSSRIRVSGVFTHESADIPHDSSKEFSISDGGETKSIDRDDRDRHSIMAKRIGSSI